MALSVTLQAASLTKLYRRITPTCMRGEQLVKHAGLVDILRGHKLDSACDGEQLTTLLR